MVPTPITTPSLSDVYKGISIGDEVKHKAGTLMSRYPRLYGFSAYDDNDSGIYDLQQETVIGRDYVAFRFLKEYPRDIVICDDRFDGMTLDNVSYCRYLEEEGRDDERYYLTEKDVVQDFGNIISVSKDALQQLKPGPYTFLIKMNTGKGYYFTSFYLIVHDKTERVDNFRVHLLNDVGYFVSQKQNDVFFCVNNTPFPIAQVIVDERVLEEGEYELVEDGFGVVFHADFLKQYGKQDAIEVLFNMQNGKKAAGRIINLDRFDF